MDRRAALRRALDLRVHAEAIRNHGHPAFMGWESYAARHRRWLTNLRDAYAVTADAFEEAGHSRAAGYYRNLTRETTRLLQRPERLYRRARRKGLPASKAFKRSRPEGHVVVRQWIGDDPTDSIEGGYIVRYLTGEIAFEWIRRIYRNPQEVQGSRAARKGYAQDGLVYRIPLERKAVPTWINLNDLAGTNAISPTAFRRMWSSRNPQEQAFAREMVGRQYSWEELDPHPIRLTIPKLTSRYGKRFKKVDLE